MPTSLKEIAALAGVSHATVSKALSGRHGVNAKTRDRICALARELKYQPSGLGRALVSGKTRCIGVYFNHGRLPSGSFSTMFETANAMLQDRGYHMMVMTRSGGNDPVPMAMRSRMVDGVVVTHTRDKDIESSAESLGINVVLLNTEPASDQDCVVADADGVSLAIEHLIGLGHRRIAFVNSPYASAHVSQKMRADGYVRAMASAGLPAYVGSDLHQPVSVAVDRLLAAEAEPTAMVCFNDFVAMAVIHELDQRGRRVPEQISVVGCDDELEALQYFRPPLTTLRVPFAEMGARAMDLLLARLEGDASPEKFDLFPLELVARRSTAPVVAG